MTDTNCGVQICKVCGAQDSYFIASVRTSSVPSQTNTSALPRYMMIGRCNSARSELLSAALGTALSAPRSLHPGAPLCRCGTATSMSLGRISLATSLHTPSVIAAMANALTKVNLRTRGRVCHAIFPLSS